MTTENEWRRLERRLATAWLNRAGASLLILGAALFVKYAADRAWLSPVVWVTIGVAGGLGLALAGHALAAYAGGPSHALMAGGVATLYLTVYAASVVYGLVGHAPAFAGMVVITVAAVALALRHDGRAIAVLATAGGFVAAVVLGVEWAPVTVRLGFVAMLDAGVLATAYWRRWPELYRLSFAGTQIMYWWGLPAPDDPGQRAVAVAWAAVFFLLFALVPVALVAGGRVARTQGAWVGHAVLTFAVPLVFFLAVQVTLRVNEGHPLAAFTVGLAAIYALLARWLERGNARLAAIHAAVAIGLLTLAVGVEAGDRHVSPAWSAEALGLLWAGFRLGSAALRWGALALLGMAIFRWWDLILPAQRHQGTLLVDHPAFVATAALAGAAAVGAVLYRRRAAGLTERERFAWPALILVTASAVAMLVMLEIELHPGVVHTTGTALVAQALVWALVAAGLLLAAPADATGVLPVAAALVLGAVTLGTAVVDVRYWPPFALPVVNPRMGLGVLVTGLWALLAIRVPRSPALPASVAGMARMAGWAGAGVFLLWTLSMEIWLSGDSSGARDLRVSLLWGFYALAAMAVGLRCASSPVRLGALSLFGATVVKVFVFDLAAVDPVYRILSFLILGGVLLAASFVYARPRTRASS